MTRETDLLRQLGERARQSPDAGIDVARRVVERLARQRVSVLDWRLALVLAAACSLSVASVVTLWSQETEADSLAELSEFGINQTGPQAILRMLAP